MSACRTGIHLEVVIMPKLLAELPSELKYEIAGILLVTGGILSIISLLGLNVGPVGLFITKMYKFGFGVGAPILPLLLLAIGSRYVWTRQAINYSVKFWALGILYVLLLAVYHHWRIPAGQEILPDSLVPGGGMAGGMVLFLLRKFFGVDGAIIVLVALSVCTIILATTWSLGKTLLTAKQKAEESIASAREALASTMEEGWEEDQEEQVEQPAGVSGHPHFYNQECDDPLAADHNEEPGIHQDDDKTQPVIHEPAAANHAYMLPPLSILKKPNKPKTAKPSKEIVHNAAVLEETLANFNVKAKIVNTCQGPAVTRYELEPAPGVKVSKIVNLADDIALKLAATGVRIEAPIPGKSVIGIEVPNKDIAGVHLRDVLESREFQQTHSHLTVGLGKDIAGQPIIADLAKMPHLLVAGATGSGKSVCINTLITSILFKATPEEVKFILVDPKVVELSNYNGIPHLMTPVVTDAKKAASALNWAVQEMERRYAAFAATGVRDLARYNEAASDGSIPQVVIIIDELADLMMAAPVDVEDAICRLAQKARAAGIHLVLATQRPSVDVITGTIKANIPSRISFAVSSQVDSRTILDMAGAEKLLGKGDMLFYPVGAAKPLRVQGAFISDDEVEELVTYIKRLGSPEYNEGITTCTGSENEEKPETEHFQDELLEEAVRMVMETGQASVSMLQRKFRVGYTRAARLIDTMEEMKIVGPNVGSKPRDILMTSDQVFSRYFKNKS
jgi:S-DNA-T family DNA segregation ATPase FtsK/SpoIIIE